MNYYLYARKSQESEDRQIQSIDDQISNLKRLADDLGINVIKVFTESKSAKKPNDRPIFNKMIEAIESGKADGILCWQINRLSRNPVDSARIQWLLQEGIIKSIQTIDKEYKPEDNVLMFSVESGMANQFILDLRKNTLRGLKGKVEKGGYISKAPVGYLNDKVNKTIIKDPERFNIIREAWNLMLNEKHNVPKILSIINKKYHFKTPVSKRSGNKPLAMSSLYRIFSNKFYTGTITYQGKEYVGIHEPMITIDEFNKIQEILGYRNKPKPQKHNFAFTGIIKCGHCGCSITAETKNKHIVSTNKTAHYTYYRCTRRKKDSHCHEKPIRIEDLEKQITNELKKYTIPSGFTKLALEVLAENHKNETKITDKLYSNLKKKYKSLELQSDNLTKLRLKDLLTDEEFMHERTKLKNEIAEIKQKLSQNQDRAINWNDIMEEAFDFVATAEKSFINGDIKTKRNIFSTLGQSYTLTNGELKIKPMEWLVPISNHQKKIEKQMERLEPSFYPVNKRKNRDFSPILSLWGA
ncbi:recombinase family protein [bacterium]|jgi:site-specific DNA recombinase|nr:recombinase family protein [bacterium]MBT4121935.1 recombinase family protein [bacterium]MBT4334898.1 recombinase family protein [bacterium]MBT4495841.1 recombinase family protein [bacterium]MBT4763718.1 recombinase family protein [bacterium]